MIVSPINYMTAATVTVTGEDTSYPASYAKEPQRPFLPSKTLTLGDRYWVVDFGSVVTVPLLALAHVNFTTGVRWQGNPTNDWGAPAYNEAVPTITRCPWTWRYQVTRLLTAPIFSYRYGRLVVPNQSTTDGATAYRLGGIWAGGVVTLPTPWGWQAEMRTILPRLDQAPDHGGWGQRLVLGDPRLHVTARVTSRLTRASPAVGDTLASWQEAFRQLWFSDVFWLYMDKGDASSGWPMRRADDIVWRIDAGLAEAPWELDEVVGP